MKRLIIAISVMAVIFTACSSTKDINKVVFNDATQQKILLGKINRKGFSKKEFSSWFKSEYDSYVPNAKVVNELKGIMPDNAKFIVVLGTWCSDSQREVPRFYKVMDEIGFSEDAITVYAVDENKLAGDIDISSLDIEYVPTIIYYHYGYEAGRIIEFPNKSIEEDILSFRSKKGH